MSVEKRDVITCFALTKTEKKILIEACEKQNIRMSDYMRRLIMKQVRKDTK